MIKNIDFQWKKIWFTKFAKIYLLIAIAISVVVEAIFSFTLNITQGRELADLPSMGIIEINMLSIDVATIFLLIFVSIEIGREFQNKSIQTYICAIPNRTRYFISSLLTYLGISIVIAIITGILSLGIGSLTLHLLNKPFPLINEVMRFFFGCIFMPITYVVLAICAAFFFRSTAGGIVVPMFIMFLPSFIKIFPKLIQDTFIPMIPASAIHSISGIAEKGGAEDVGIILALLTLIIWCIIGSMIAINNFRRNDI